MKVANITNVIKKFLDNNDRTILIDGPWGVGKTYYVLDFLKEAKKEKSKFKVAYVSVFGKSTIDEIHTEIYKEFHPHIARTKTLVNAIPKIASLIPDVGGAVGSISEIIGKLEYTLKTDKKDRILSKKSNMNLIILDDLERMEPDKISYNEMLGYINNLIMQQLKVVIICNSSEIKSDDFTPFKEKVIDREYKISATNEEIIKSMFVPSEILDEKLMAEFNSNIRLARRTSTFYKDVINQLKACNPNYSDIYSDIKILKSCVLTVISACTDNYSKAPEYNPDSTLEKALSIVNGDDKTIEKHIIQIRNYIKTKSSDDFIFIKPLLIALLNYYFYDNKENLEVIFKLKNSEANPMFASPFLLSDSEKIILFRKQLEYIYNGNPLTNIDLAQILDNMYNYSKFSNIYQEEDKLIDLLIKNNNIYENSINRLLNWSSTFGDAVKSFSNKLHRRLNEHQVNELIKDLNDAWQARDYQRLFKLLSKIPHSTFCFTLGEEKTTLKEEVINEFRAGDFYLTNLYGTITDAQWDIALIMVDNAKHYGFKEEVEAIMKKLETKDDLSAQNRYNYLIGRLSGKIE